MAGLYRLTDNQTNDLRELGNVGFGFAASRLGNLAHERCLTELPRVLWTDKGGIRSALSADDSFAVSVDVRLRGDFQADMLVILKTAHADLLVERMAKAAAAAATLPPNRETALKLMGEGVVQAFSDAVNDFLKTRTKLSSAEITIHLWPTVLDKVLMRIIASGEERLSIFTDFSNPGNSFHGKMAYLLNATSQSFILNRLYEMANPVVVAPVNTTF